MCACDDIEELIEEEEERTLYFLDMAKEELLPPPAATRIPVAVDVVDDGLACGGAASRPSRTGPVGLRAIGASILSSPAVSNLVIFASGSANS